MIKLPNTLFYIALLTVVGCRVGVATGSSASGEEPAQCLQKEMQGYRASSQDAHSRALAYFSCFPSDFTGFMKIFGSEEAGAIPRYAPLYEVAHEHVLGMLPKMQTEVGKDRLFNKLVGIAVGGRWQADAPNYLQEVLRQELTADRAAFLKVLDLRSDDEVKEFWRFYDDGPHGPRGGPSPCKPGDKWRSCSFYSKHR